ncbi:hypothetical protein AB1N83_014174 [Pleurotus pulmonarius]
MAHTAHRWIRKAISTRAASATSKTRKRCWGDGTQRPGAVFEPFPNRYRELLHRERCRTPDIAPPAQGSRSEYGR